MINNKDWIVVARTVAVRI